MKPFDSNENNMFGALVIPNLICIKFYRTFVEQISLFMALAGRIVKQEGRGFNNRPRQKDTGDEYQPRVLKALMRCRCGEIFLNL